MIYKDCQCYPRQITRADSLLKEIEAVSKRMNHCEVQGESCLEEIRASHRRQILIELGVGGLFLRATAGGHKEHTTSTAP